MNTEKYLMELLEVKDQQLNAKDEEMATMRRQAYELSQLVGLLCNFSMAQTDEEKKLLQIKNELREMSRPKD